MAFIELDHTSSGVQIAAALTRNLPTASATNIAGNQQPNDLYTLIVDDTNKGLHEIGYIDEGHREIERNDIKRASIAMVYGGGLSNNAGQALFTKYGENDAGALDALSVAIRTHMEAVMVVQKHMEHLVKAVHTAGHKKISIPLFNGSTFSEVIGVYKRSATFRSQIQEDNETYSAYCRDVEYIMDEDIANRGKTARTLTAALVQGLDATLLARTQLELHKMGVPFYSKHDAYLIDEGYRPQLTTAVQNVFYSVFKQDILKDVTDYVKLHYPTADVYTFDKYGDYDIELVKQSPHLISE